MSIYMINLSIDASDVEGRTFDPNVNEIESIVELVLEVIMDKSDALPEHDEPDPEAETCLVLLDHIIPSSVLFDMENKFYQIVGKPGASNEVNYKNPVLSYPLPPPRAIS